jgi:hypothetical protein
MLPRILISLGLLEHFSRVGLSNSWWTWTTLSLWMVRPSWQLQTWPTSSGQRLVELGDDHAIACTVRPYR